MCVVPMNLMHERRRHVRHLCSAVAEILIKTGPDAGASYVALINDICVKGLRLSMDGKIDTGAQVVITVPGQVEFVGLVRHVRQDGREYSIGVEFTVGEWNQQSDWPRHRWLPGQE
jgi:hypothetical protein